MTQNCANNDDPVAGLLLDQQNALGTYLGSLLQEQADADKGDDFRGQQQVAPVTRFEVQLFSAAGITLAVPLSDLAGVISVQQQLGPVPGQSPLVIGSVSWQGVESQVVDTAGLVLPADRAALDPVTRGRAASLLVIDDGRWALACKQIGEVVALDRSEVKWRSSASKRPWLAGTVSERGCALLDVEQLVLLLTESMA